MVTLPGGDGASLLPSSHAIKWLHQYADTSGCFSLLPAHSRQPRPPHSPFFGLSLLFHFLLPFSKCSHYNKLNFHGSISFFPIMEAWHISSRKYFQNHNWNAIIHNRNGRRRGIDLALVSGGRHVNDIFYFLSLPHGTPPAGHARLPLLSPGWTHSPSHSQQPEGKLGNTKPSMSL